jgi:hypothetical protein
MASVAARRIEAHQPDRVAAFTRVGEPAGDLHVEAPLRVDTPRAQGDTVPRQPQRERSVDAQVGADHREARVPLVHQQRGITRVGDERGGEVELQRSASRAADRHEGAGAERRDVELLLEAVGDEDAAIGQFAHPAHLRELVVERCRWAA